LGKPNIDTGGEFPFKALARGSPTEPKGLKWRKTNSPPVSKLVMNIFPSKSALQNAIILSPLTLYLGTGCTLSLEGENSMEELTRGELAREGRVNIETIRYYERRGLLPKPERTPSGYRIFSFDDVRRVRFIKRAQELGFSLKEIKDLLALQREPRSTRAEVRKRAEAKIADIEEKLRDLEAMKRSLERLTATCSGRGPVCGCPILESFDSTEENHYASKESRKKASD
jgi:MerR family transcriptional regulator, copper efflux regulator